MSRITKEDVLQAIARLDDAGTEVTVLNLRKDLGRGSYSTISKHLNDYRTVEEDQNTNVTTLPAVTIENVPSELLEWSQRIALEAASYFAHEREAAIEAIKVEKNAKIKTLSDELEQERSEKADAMAISEAQELEIDELREDLAAQQKVQIQVRKERDDQIEQLKAALAKAEGKIETLEQVNKELSSRVTVRAARKTTAAAAANKGEK